MSLVPDPRTDTTPPRRDLGIAAVSLTTLIWGFVFVAIKSTSTPPLTFAMYRLWAGAAVYMVILAGLRRRLRWRTLRACAPGGVFFAADLSLAFVAVHLTGVANVSIIGALSPLVIAFAAARWFAERFGRTEALFGLAALAGVALVAVGSAGTPAWSPVGDSLAFVGVFSWAAYWLFSKRARSDVPAIEYMASVMTVAAAVVTPVALLSGKSLGPPAGRDLLYMWLVVLFAGAAGHTMIAWAHRHVEAWLASLITQCQPVIAALAAWGFLGEKPTGLMAAGGLVVLAATAAVVVRAARRAPEPGGLDLEDVEVAVERPA